MAVGSKVPLGAGLGVGAAVGAEDSVAIGSDDVEDPASMSE